MARGLNFRGSAIFYRYEWIFLKRAPIFNDRCTFLKAGGDIFEGLVYFLSTGTQVIESESLPFHVYLHFLRAYMGTLEGLLYILTIGMQIFANDYAHFQSSRLCKTSFSMVDIVLL